MEADTFQDRNAFVVFEPDILELDVAADAIEWRLVRVHIVFGRGIENLANAIEPRERLGDLGSDRGN